MIVTHMHGNGISQIDHAPAEDKRPKIFIIVPYIAERVIVDFAIGLNIQIHG